MGERTKTEVRAVATEMGLRTRPKPESMDISAPSVSATTGLPPRRRARRSSSRGHWWPRRWDRARASRTGSSGSLGQRRGLRGVAVGEPRFVVRIDSAHPLAVGGHG